MFLLIFRFKNHYDTENRPVAHSERGRERFAAQLHVPHSEQINGVHAGEHNVW